MMSSILSIILVINELMASNVGSVMSPACNFDSWIEIYNPTEQSVNLSGMYLSKWADSLKSWRMPSNIGIVPAKGFLVVWLGSNDISTKQAPFKLDCDGGTIYLSDRYGELITSEQYPKAMSRTAWARTTDGGSTWGWTDNPTPGKTNATSVFADKRLDPPVVSEGSQILNGTLTVKVDIPPGTTLMYTTNGSMPTASSSTNSASHQSMDGVFTVSRTTNYVFRLFRDGYLPSVPVTRSFIQTSNTYTIPIISIVGDQRYFADAMWGIDVKGSNGIPGNGRDDPVNWNQPWDRPVNFSYISPTEGMLFNQDVNISVSGGWSRMNSPRSMKLKSNKVFDDQNHLDYSFFPQKPHIRNKALLVRNGGNDSYSRFMDPALTTIIQRSGIDLDLQSLVQVAEYINGTFKGVLNLREPNNDKFVYANFGYDDDEIDMFENTTFTNGTDKVFNHIVELSKEVASTSGGRMEEAYDEVKQLLDIDEFTNYMAAELFLGNDDWPNNNVKAYRSQHDGRYRFIIFDLDQPFNAWDHTITSSIDNYQSYKMMQLFKNLLHHDEYRKKFIDTFCIMAGSVFEKERATAIINELADAMRPMQRLDSRTPDGTANNIKNKLSTRLDVTMNQLEQYRPMQLSGVRKMNVQLASDTDGANIYINGINVPYASFNGKLFEPALIEAKAPVGYTFTGWRKSSGSTIEVFGNNGTWKYYDRGQLSGTTWRTTSFNDASWNSGTAPLGYSMSGIHTTISYGTNSQQKYPTTYFRKTFTLNDAPTTGDVFQLNYRVDDGCVIWVNGQEAGRVNMPAGTVSYTTFSTTYAGDTPMTGTIDLSPQLFRKGSNVIAVEVHNTSYTSSDLYWDGELRTSVGTSSDETILEDRIIDLAEASGQGTGAGGRLILTACFTPIDDAGLMAQGITPVRVNEVSADNSIYVNEYFKRNDWVELYNTTDDDIDVEGMYLSDNPEKPKKYQITAASPTGGGSEGATIIPAHGYLIIWCDKLEPQSQLHASFKLAAEGGDVLLTAADESWTDRFTYTPMKDDETAGRYPDGSGDVVTMNVPTIGKTNIAGSYSVTIPQTNVTGIHEVRTQQIASTQVYNLKGQAVQGALRPGIYIINGRKFIKK